LTSGASSAPTESRGSLTRFGLLAIATALVVIAIKVAAWRLTGSVGLLSDAVESVANLAGAIMALAMLWLAARPPDEEHAYGHTKAEYFSSGFEGGLIVVAAASIIWVAVPRLMDPQPVAQPTLGLVLAAVATVLNVVVARILFRAGERFCSITLEAQGHHLMTDVWTSVGVIGGVAVVALTGWNILDPLVALAVAIHILFVGSDLVRRSAMGLLDTALPEEARARIHGVLAHYEEQGIQFHALRSRRAGRKSFVSLHVLVPGEWTIQRGHDLAEEVELAIQAAVPGSHVLTHLEPVEDPASFEDARIPSIDELLDRFPGDL
jgi:cation diffusion facilitator family transporter